MVLNLTYQLKIVKKNVKVEIGKVYIKVCVISNLKGYS